MVDSPKLFKKKLKKPIDKPTNLCYNKYKKRQRKEIKKNDEQKNLLRHGWNFRKPVWSRKLVRIYNQ